MEDQKLRELSKDFLKDNVLCHSITPEGEITHKFKNGRIRKIYLFQRLVKILDSEKNELYSNVLDESHPLIKCAKLYYKLHFMKKGVDYAGYLRIEREKRFILSEIEEIYFLV